MDIQNAVGIWSRPFSKRSFGDHVVLLCTGYVVDKSVIFGLIERQLRPIERCIRAGDSNIEPNRAGEPAGTNKST